MLNNNIIISFFLYHLVLLLRNGVRSEWVVHTRLGHIEGWDTTDGGFYYTFLGIPYGSIDNPFGLAKPYPPFRTLFKAIEDDVMCPQAFLKDDGSAVGVGIIDCLRLNIYVPLSAAVDKKKLPVMVYLHGGKFSYGACNKKMFGPKYLVQHDIILVTVNFRMGPYGFLCLNEPYIPGNQGLKDQVLALRWIRNNIYAFGGDHNSITIMGESSGAKAADLHMHSNNELLFHRMIMQGGTAFSLPPDLSRQDTIQLMQIAEKFYKKKHFSDDELIRDFVNLDPTQLSEIAEKYPNFIPCTEEQYEGVQTFIHENPINLRIPKAHGISILLGYTADDQNLNHIETNPNYYKKWNQFRDKLALSFNFTRDQLSALENVVRKFYIGDEAISYKLRLDLGNFESDFSVMHPVERTISKYLENGANKAFYYVFSYVGSRNLMRQKANTRHVGAVHADELGYLFDMPYMLPANVTPEDQLIIDRITMLWTNFAKYGDPTPYQTELLPVRWAPITKDSPKFFLDINTNLTIGTSPFYSRMAFWDLFYEAYGKFQYGYKEKQEFAYVTPPTPSVAYYRQKG